MGDFFFFFDPVSSKQSVNDGSVVPPCEYGTAIKGKQASDERKWWNMEQREELEWLLENRARERETQCHTMHVRKSWR